MGTYQQGDTRAVMQDSNGFTLASAPQDHATMQPHFLLDILELYDSADCQLSLKDFRKLKACLRKVKLHLMISRDIERTSAARKNCWVKVKHHVLNVYHNKLRNVVL